MTQTFNKFYIRTRDGVTDKVIIQGVAFKDLKYFLELPNTVYYKTIVHDSDRIQVHTIVFECDVMRGNIPMYYTLTYESTTIK